MYTTVHSPATISLTVTPVQFDRFMAALTTAKARDLAIADWTGESSAAIDARYQLPGDEMVADRADYHSQLRTGIPMF